MPASLRERSRAARTDGERGRDPVAGAGAPRRRRRQQPLECRGALARAAGSDAAVRPHAAGGRGAASMRSLAAGERQPSCSWRGAAATTTVKPHPQRRRQPPPRPSTARADASLSRGQGAVAPARRRGGPLTDPARPRAEDLIRGSTGRCSDRPGAHAPRRGCSAARDAPAHPGRRVPARASAQRRPDVSQLRPATRRHGPRLPYVFELSVRPLRDGVRDDQLQLRLGWVFEGGGNGRGCRRWVGRR